MDNQVKSGKEILDDFFGNITNLPGVDREIAEKILELYKAGKLTSTNIANALVTLREENASGKN
ncbi:MAG: hypothetical protein HZA11_07280 [Nitrospirae bacterium]|nr:hypothetical protein [Nitrospirota bacterium]